VTSADEQTNFAFHPWSRTPGERGSSCCACGSPEAHSNLDEEKDLNENIQEKIQSN